MQQAAQASIEEAVARLKAGDRSARRRRLRRAHARTGRRHRPRWPTAWSSARRSSIWSASMAPTPPGPVREFTAALAQAVHSIRKEHAHELAQPRPQRRCPSSRRSATRPTTSGSSARRCSEMLFTKEYEENLSVCPRCDHHGRIGAEARLDAAARHGAFTAAARARRSRKTRSSSAIPKRYTDRLKAARAANPHADALINARRHDRGPPGGRRRAGLRLHGRFDGHGGGRGLRRRRRARDQATSAPYIIFTAAGGARMQEGILSPDADAQDHRRDRRARARPGCPISSC